MSIAGAEPSMSGSGFCLISAPNSLNGHASDLGARRIELGCFGYNQVASTQITVLESSLLYLQARLPQCP